MTHWARLDLVSRDELESIRCALRLEDLQDFFKATGRAALKRDRLDQSVVHDLWRDLPMTAFKVRWHVEDPLDLALFPMS